jgi:hypothetical protein
MGIQEVFGRVQVGAGTPGISQNQIDEIVGEGARDREGKGNANVGDGGVAFVLSSCSPSPGVSDTVRLPSWQQDTLDNPG